MNNQAYIFQKPHPHDFVIAFFEKETCKLIKTSESYSFKNGPTFSDRLNCFKEKSVLISDLIIDIDDDPSVTLTREILFSNKGYVFLNFRTPYFAESFKPFFISKGFSGFKFIGVCDYQFKNIEDVIAYCLLLEFDYGYPPSW